MLSSNSSSCNHNPFPENDITSFTSKSHQHPNHSFFAFPTSPHVQLHYDDVSFSYLDHFLDHFYLNAHTPAAERNEHAAIAANPTTAAAAVKKDRHSKINTARGLRDRRMRLSLDVARKFFDLQDLLGYEKASRTVDWLLRSSRKAIHELVRASRCRESCTSDDLGEAVSSSNTDEMAVEASSCTKVVHSRRGKRGRGQAQVQRRRASVGRESRKKARERARERTSQKRRLMRENSNAAATTTVFGESNCFPIPVKDLRSISGATANEGAFSFNFHQNYNIENNAAFLHQDEQIAEFEYDGRPWEAYNSFNLCE